MGAENQPSSKQLRQLSVPRRGGSTELHWPGFDLELVGSVWSTPFEIVLDVGFSSAERQATLEYFERIPGLRDRPGTTAPSQDASVSLTLREGNVLAGRSEQYFQFRGREYAKQVVKVLPEGQSVFENVGTVFWYTEHRTFTSLTAEIILPSNKDESNGERAGPEGGYLHFDENLLRRRLTDFMQFHLRVERGEYALRPGQRDLFAELENAWARVFPNRRFEGSVPRSDVDDVLKEPWFFLYDGHRQYEISEMSGGERAVFPLLFDFANWHINNSVILIDEIELHLHPPLQQALIRALPGLGRNNQFIITTHSDWVANILPPECVYRLE